MKKATILMLLVVLIGMLFIFQNIYMLFEKIEKTDITKIRNPQTYMENISRIRKIFGALSVITALLVVGTGVYLTYLYKFKRTHQPVPEAIPPLQDYLLQLKGKETQLLDMVEKQQEHVTRKEELNKSIINNIKSAVIFMGPSRRIEVFNPVAQQMFAQSYVNARNNLPGRILANYPELATFIDTHAGAAASSEVASNEKIFQVDLNPVENIGQLALIKDITQEKRRDEIDRRNSNFIMLGEMAAFLAHEIRNSLGVIYGYTKTFKTETQKTAKVNKEIDHLTTMMESFLNFSKPVTVTNKESLPLEELLKQTAVETGIEITIEARPEGQENVTLETDPTLIRPVFSNLLINSREAGADTVKITITKGKDLEILVDDNGGGIDDTTREKIWYPFYTTKDKGTGMGLAMIRKIINSLNGEIVLDDTGSGGTVFKIIFYS